ncbi:hypothetical protein C9J21_19975 [Photobacterium phosphoreum]|nr:hypothetical protein C9J21_19975 [Photobacterium phosphoreum]
MAIYSINTLHMRAIKVFGDVYNKFDGLFLRLSIFLFVLLSSKIKIHQYISTLRITTDRNLNIMIIFHG